MENIRNWFFTRWIPNNALLVTRLQDTAAFLPHAPVLCIRCNGKGYDVYNSENRVATVLSYTSFYQIMGNGVFLCGYIVNTD